MFVSAVVISSIGLLLVWICCLHGCGVVGWCCMCFALYSSFIVCAVSLVFSSVSGVGWVLKLVLVVYLSCV